QTASYIRSVTGNSPAAEIAAAAALLDSGSITESEYHAIKAKALS
ncbi:SHOCT domain-containing protein, partial [Leucobacter sp. M11]|nr:SHOCT domain-containing protein [Leucobacter sp. M11]